MQKSAFCTFHAKALLLSLTYPQADFKPMQKKNYPILMADVIKSSHKESKQLIVQLKKIAALINKTRKKNIVSPLTITLGDEFQGITDTVENGIETIIAIEELIIHNNFDLKLRYVLSYGQIDTLINTAKAYEMLGEGLTITRANLLHLKTTDHRFLINVNQYSKIDAELINDAFVLYQFFIDGWKQGDYKIVSAFLQYTDYKIVSTKVDLNISSAWRREKSLHIKQYQTSKSMIQKIIHQ